MNKEEKQKWIKEAELQSDALRRISLWRTMAMLLASIGIVGIYFGFTGEQITWLLAIGGIALTAISAAAAVILNVGIHNGRDNVEKILQAVEEAKA